MTDHYEKIPTVNHHTHTEQGNLEQAPELPEGWLRNWPWVTFLLPMILFLLMGSFEPKPPETGYRGEDGISSEENASEENWDDVVFEEEEGFFPTIAYRHYPLVYSIKIVWTALAMLLVWPGYRTFRWHVSPLAIGVGGIGIVLWIGLCHLDLESWLLESIGLGRFADLGQRSAFNPLIEMTDTPLWAILFLGIRFFGLAVVVPIFEEFFLRGFLMRYVMAESWWKVPFGTANRTALVMGTLVAMLMHPPGEWLAAMVWFSLITWLMLRTRNIWDCVAAHATTNLLLGIYVVAADQWQLM